MSAIITTLHIIACIFLVAVVLLQRGKGAQVGAVFGGGGGSTMFGSRGAGNFLTKLTAGAATVFMLTSLSLSYLGISGQGERLFEDGSIEDTAEESLFEEFGTVPAAAGDALDEAGTAAAGATEGASSALGALAEEAGSAMGDAAASAGAVLDDAAAAASDLADEANAGVEAPLETETP